MRFAPPIITALLLLATPAMGLGVVENPACDIPVLSIVCITIVLGDIVVLNGQEEEFNNGTYVFQGTVTVQDGGRLEIINANAAFSEQGAVIHVQSGGEAVIEGSIVTSVPDGDLPVIQLEAGSIATVTETAFSAINVVIETQDLTTFANTFRLGNPAVTLNGFDGTFEQQTFDRNDIGLQVNGGSPQLQVLEFTSNTFGINLDNTSADLDIIRMTDIQEVGIKSFFSQGSYQTMNLQDSAGPPVGMILGHTTNTVYVDDAFFQDLAIGIFTCDADTQYSGLTFSNVDQSFVDCSA